MSWPSSNWSPRGHCLGHLLPLLPPCGFGGLNTAHAPEGEAAATGHAGHRHQCQWAARRTLGSSSLSVARCRSLKRGVCQIEAPRAGRGVRQPALNAIPARRKKNRRSAGSNPTANCSRAVWLRGWGGLASLRALPDKQADIAKKQRSSFVRSLAKASAHVSAIGGNPSKTPCRRCGRSE